MFITVQLDRRSVVPLYQQVEAPDPHGHPHRAAASGCPRPRDPDTGRGPRRGQGHRRRRLRAARRRGIPRRPGRLGHLGRDRAPGSGAADRADAGAAGPRPSQGRSPRPSPRGAPRRRGPGRLPGRGLGGRAFGRHGGRQPVAPLAGPAGVVDLRAALSAYLDAGRATRTDPRQIVVGHGPRVLLAALIAALDAEGGPSRIPVLGLLEPVDAALRTTARRNGATTLDVPIDRAAVHAAAGVVLVEDDRAALLRLAGWQPAALQGSLAIGRIALLGGLGQLLVPGTSLGWIVVPGVTGGRRRRRGRRARRVALHGRPASDRRVDRRWRAGSEGPPASPSPSVPAGRARDGAHGRARTDHRGRAGGT